MPVPLSVGAVLVALMATTLTAVPQASAVTSASSCPLTTASAPTCGRWWGEALDPGTQSLTAAVTGAQASTGRRLDIVHTYHRWDDPFPTTEETEVARSGHLLLIGWKPLTLAGTPVSWASITDGSQDAVIAAEAARLKALDTPVLLSFSYEPEHLVGTDGTPAQFAGAFRHVHDLMVADGATNVSWVWTLMGLDSAYWHRAYHQMWPGSRFVDWISWDPYNWSSCRHTTSVSFAAMVGPFYRWVIAQGFGFEPLMLSEYGTVERAGLSGAKAAWFSGESRTLSKFPRLKALVYFNLPSPPASCDWLTTSSPSSAASFRRLASGSGFAATSQMDPVPLFG